jgi:hypothetical protein
MPHRWASLYNRSTSGRKYVALGVKYVVWTPRQGYRIIVGYEH